MLVDSRQIPAGTVLDADICVIGSGPAGIALAREFDRTTAQVLVLEAGGIEDREWQGQCCGGASNRWVVHTTQSSRGIRLLPFAEADFDARPGSAVGGWPFPRAELEPYYLRAQPVFGLSPHDYRIEPWAEPGAAPLPLAGTRVQTSLFQFGRGDAVSEEGVGALVRSGNITLCHHATALELMSDDRGTRITGVRVASAPQREWHVRADRVVIAGGGLAAAELLLGSDGVRPAGLGNDHDVVGRYFMDHPLLLGGEFVPASPRLFEAMDLYDLRTVRGTPVMGHLTLTDEALRREPVLNLSLLLYPRGPGDDDPHRLSPRQQQGLEAARRIRRSLVRSGVSARDVIELARGADGVARSFLHRLRPPNADLNRGGWSRQRGKPGRYTHFEVLHQAEQAPHRENRIVLTEATDPFGRRKARLDWRWHDEDVAAVLRAQDIFADDLRRAGLGEFRIARPDGQPQVISPSTLHHMGATRMSDDPRTGVVDRNCRVHGIDNLFVASASVFPTGGYANPTLTIVALALRLADHLKGLRDGSRRAAAAVHPDRETA